MASPQPPNLTRVFIALFALVVVSTPVDAIVPSKSGVTPNAISLPTGPGAIEGFGESFDVQINTGSGRYSLPMKVPPGRVGFEPSLGITYDTGFGNGKVGMGWQLSGMSVKRQSDKGLPAYGNSIKPAADTFITEDGAELVRVEGLAGDEVQQFRLEIEGRFMRYVYFKTEDRWEVTDRSGIRYSLGARFDNGDVKARTIHPDNGQTYAWFLAAAHDLNGNVIRYEYERYELLPYCVRIQYSADTEDAGDGHEIVLSYENRSDPVIDYRPGFRLVTTRRLAEVSQFTLGQLVRRYRLGYDPGSIISRLVRFTQVGRDDTTTLPPALFQYSTAIPQATSEIQPLSGMGTASLLLRGENPDSFRAAAEVIDFNGDGLPDFYQSKTPTGPPDEFDVFYQNLGAGQFQRVNLGLDESLNVPIQSRDSFVKDIDGDGLADLVARLGINPEDFVYRINLGGAWSDTNTPFVVPGSNSLTNLFRGDEVRSVDLDFDKRVDTLRSFPTVGPSGAGVAFTAFLNLGDGTFNVINQTMPDVLQGLSQTFAEAQGALMLADLDGDRLQDLVLLRDATNGGPKYWPSSGYGTFDDSTGGYVLALTDGPDFGGDTTQARSLDLQDLNGDGLADLFRVEGTRLRFWPNLGNGSFGSQHNINFGYLFDPNFATYRVLDIDADGLTDLLFFAESTPTPDYLPAGFSFYRLYADQSGNDADEIDNDSDGQVDEADEANSIPNLLVSISNGIGNSTSLYFESHIQHKLRDRARGVEWQTNSPFPVTVLTRQESSDGLNRYVTRFSYRNIYYSGEEKEFRGFEDVDVLSIGDASVPDLLTRHRFDTGKDTEALKGKLLELESRGANGELFNKEINTWVAREVASTEANEARTVDFPYLSEREKQFFEKTDTPVIVQWEFDYDDYGNKIRELERGRVDAGWDDERLTVTRWSAEFEGARTRWILNREVEQIVSDENNARASHQRRYYDANLTLGEMDRGNVTRVEDWVSDSTWQISKRMDVDAFGNTVAIYDGLFGIEPGHYRELEYDPVFNTFPILETVHVAGTVPVLQLSAEYDAGGGVVTASRNFNSHQTTYDYDAFYRLTAIIKPGDSPGFPTMAYDYEIAAPIGAGKTINWIETRKRETTGGGTLDSRTYFDGFGRIISKRSEAEAPGEVIVSQFDTYNSRGGVHLSYLPYSEIGDLGFDVPDEPAPRVSHFYDALARPVRSVEPDGLFSTTEYLPLEVVSQDKEQNRPESPHFRSGRIVVKDGLSGEGGELGRIREVIEVVRIDGQGSVAEPPAQWRTQVNFDLLNKVSSHIDSYGNRTDFEHDGLGRRVAMHDPDFGTTLLGYDAAGNLSTRRTANGFDITLSYDGANRLRTESTASEGLISEYFYDVPTPEPLTYGPFWVDDLARDMVNEILTGTSLDPLLDVNSDGQLDAADLVFRQRDESSRRLPKATNTLGELAWVRDQSGEEHLSYDPRGRTTSVTKRIADRNGALVNFHSRFAYDALDRVTTHTFPNGTGVEYEYNQRGLNEAIPGIIDNVDYTAAGQLARLEYANGVVTTYTFDVQNRLARMQSSRPMDGLVIFDESFDYDGVDNIVGKSDGRSGEALSAIAVDLGLSAEETAQFSGQTQYRHDSLYRLLEADNPSSFGAIRYEYDQLGNLVGKHSASDPSQDLGQIFYGGAAGTRSRQARAEGDEPGPHALTGAESAGLGGVEYDLAGNVVAWGDSAFSWDHRQQMASAIVPRASVEYRYDYKGARRFKRVVPNDNAPSSQEFYVDRFSEVINGELVNYPALLSGKVAECAGSRSCEPSAYFLNDHLGSLRMVVDPAQSVRQEVTYYPYGAIYRQKTAAGAPEGFAGNARFTGKKKDGESGLTYMDARYLDSRVGSFLSADSIVREFELPGMLINPQLRHPYRYANNKPVELYDPDGDLAIMATVVISASVYFATINAANAPGPGDKAIPAATPGEEAVNVATTFVKVPKVVKVPKPIKHRVGNFINKYVDKAGRTVRKGLRALGVTHKTKVFGTRVNTKIGKITRATDKKLRDFANDKAENLLGYTGQNQLEGYAKERAAIGVDRSLEAVGLEAPKAQQEPYKPLLPLDQNLPLIKTIPDGPQLVPGN